jgi:D-lyxose ketol-isomerase
VELTGSDAAGNCSDRHGGMVRCDGIDVPYKPGQKLKLKPGESVTLMPGDWHAFWGEGGDVLIGEVSTVNDDLTDNIFREKIGRFAQIEEDVAPTHLLVSDYEAWLK